MANAVLGDGLRDLALADGGADDGVIVGGLIDDVQIIPGLWKIQAYGAFCRTLVASVGLVEGANFFRFPYDWRRDVRTTAHTLERSASDWLTNWKRTSGNEHARIVFVAHSMGGLVARHYIECLEGWKLTRRLVSLGTPYRGSLNALGCLVNGYSKGIGPVHVNATEPLRTFTSVYQLLPTYPCIEVEGELLRVQDVDLPNIDHRCVDAAAFHNETTAAATANLGVTGYSPDYLSCLVSSRQPTYQSARPTARGVELIETICGENAGGDGTVPAPSAVPVGTDRGTGTYAWGLHSSLANQEAVQEHVVEAIRTGRIDEDRYRTGPSSGRQIKLRLDDVYTADERFDLHAEIDELSEQTLTVTTEPLGGGEVGRTVLHRDGQSYVGPLVLREGAWRITVTGLHSAPVQDVVLALPSNGESRAIDR
ncbi:lipase/acyltransferase domain-containing protein [Sphingomonas sp. NFX23]|uniref:esterase/lipase family protein n=1 Tax=Sphingomonas sp. NFX23 TaxID=2819532 RepID=UPI003CF9FB89